MVRDGVRARASVETSAAATAGSDGSRSLPLGHILVLSHSYLLGLSRSAWVVGGSEAWPQAPAVHASGHFLSAL